MEQVQWRWCPAGLEGMGGPWAAELDFLGSAGGLPFTDPQEKGQRLRRGPGWGENSGHWAVGTADRGMLCSCTWGRGVLWGCQAKLWFLASLACQEAASDLLWLGHWHTQTGQQKRLHGTQSQAVNLGVSFKFSSSSASRNPSLQLAQCPTLPGRAGYSPAGYRHTSSSARSYQMQHWWGSP